MAWTTWLDPDGNIRVRIEGDLDTAEGELTIQSVVGLLDSQPRDVVFEASAMTGYRRGVRTSWQAVLLEHRGALRRFVLIGGNSVVRMGLGVIAMSLGIPLDHLDMPEAEVVIEPDAPVKRARARSGSRPMTRPISLLGPAPGEPRRERSRTVRRSREDSRPNH
jgi:hypothetical protein